MNHREILVSFGAASNLQGTMCSEPKVSQGLEQVDGGEALCLI
jgi:hypothetical protein